MESVLFLLGAIAAFVVALAGPGPGDAFWEEWEDAEREHPERESQRPTPQGEET